MIVESVAGPSQFTTDPSRHRFMEATSSLAADDCGLVLLPERKTTDILVASYFTNVSLHIHFYAYPSKTAHNLRDQSSH